VSVVPVEGDHVMLNGVPALTVLRLVKEKGFCAVTRVARAARRKVVYCILPLFSQCKI
jgi:hypothetical protein